MSGVPRLVACDEQRERLCATRRTTEPRSENPHLQQSGGAGVSTTLAVSVSAPLITSSTAAGRITSPARDRPRRQHRRQPLFVPPDDIHLTPPAIDAGACTSCANDRLRSRNPSAILPEP